MQCWVTKNCQDETVIEVVSHQKFHISLRMRGFCVNCILLNTVLGKWDPVTLDSKAMFNWMVNVPSIYKPESLLTLGRNGRLRSAWWLEELKILNSHILRVMEASFGTYVWHTVVSFPYQQGSQLWVPFVWLLGTVQDFQVLVGLNYHEIYLKQDISMIMRFAVHTILPT